MNHITSPTNRDDGLQDCLDQCVSVGGREIETHVKYTDDEHWLLSLAPSLGRLSDYEKGTKKQYLDLKGDCLCLLVAIKKCIML